MQRIEMKQRPGGPVFYQEAGGEKRAFRRIVGGMAWPTKGQEGFLVVLGEDLGLDQAFGVRHLRVLAEAREHDGEGFLSPAALLRGAVHFRDLLAAHRWGAPDSPHVRELRTMNRDLVAKRAPRLRVDLPPEYAREKVVEHYAALVRKRLASEKTLHFGGSILPASLGNLPRDVSSLGFDLPPVTALFCAVAIMDLTSGEVGMMTHGGGPADGTAGY